MIKEDHYHCVHHEDAETSEVTDPKVRHNLESRVVHPWLLYHRPLHTHPRGISDYSLVKEHFLMRREQLSSSASFVCVSRVIIRVVRVFVASRLSEGESYRLHSPCQLVFHDYFYFIAKAGLTSSHPGTRRPVTSRRPFDKAPFATLVASQTVLLVSKMCR